MLKQKLKKAKMNNVYIGIGSNVGERLTNIRKTIEELENNSEISNIKISSIYETKPYGNIEQNNFLNAVIYFETSFKLDELLSFTKSIEKKIGRIKRENWGPREIDLDILLFNNLIYFDKNITIPHRDLLNRDFVLVPLLEIDNDLVHPESKKELSFYLTNLTEKYIISKFKFSNNFLNEFSSISL